MLHQAGCYSGIVCDMYSDGNHLVTLPDYQIPLMTLSGSSLPFQGQF